MVGWMDGWMNLLNWLQSYHSIKFVSYFVIAFFICPSNWCVCLYVVYIFCFFFFFSILLVLLFLMLMLLLLLLRFIFIDRLVFIINDFFFYREYHFMFTHGIRKMVKLIKGQLINKKKLEIRQKLKQILLVFLSLSVFCGGVCDAFECVRMKQHEKKGINKRAHMHARTSKLFNSICSLCLCIWTIFYTSRNLLLLW